MDLIIGHRGAMGYEPENTLQSFRLANELGVDMIELDVALSKDNHIMVFHDDRLERTTNGNGYLKEYSFLELRSLDAGKGEKIPTLVEVLEDSQINIPINIELKNRLVAKPVAELLRNRFNSGQCEYHDFLISSFDHHALKDFKTMLPEVRIGALIGIIPVDYAQMAEDLEAWSINPCIDFINKELVDDAKKRGLKVLVWTVNYKSDFERVKELGVDGIFTNYPDRFK